jgi:uncharacterized membrane protein
LAAALSLAPVLLIGVLLAWRWAPPLIAASMTTLGAVLVFHFWSVFERNYEWADLVQQCAVYALIAGSFGRSLYAGRIPLCTQLAAKLHGPLTPQEITYTRRATAVWTVFYALTAALILVLFFLASLRVWSLFVNFAIFGLIALMCLVDHAVRRRVLPSRVGPGILAALRQSLIG